MLVSRAAGGRAAAALGVIVAVSACGGSSTGHHKVAAVKPDRTVALPAGTLSATAVQPNGYVWVLANNHRVATLTQMELSNGAKAATVPVSVNATAVAQSPTGAIALGLGTATSGAVQLLNPAALHPVAVLVGAPVKDLAYSVSGTDLYVLNGNATSTSVTVINTGAKRRVKSIGLAQGTVAIVPNPTDTAIWSLTDTGTVTETSLTGKHLAMTSFSLRSRGIALALNPIGSTLYVLKGAAASPNVSVVDTATSSQVKALPAAAHSVALGVSMNGSELYDYVGTARYGNVQVFSL
ncbi:MAG: YncE family protein [Solirubrobacteraceae bacterium]